MTDNILDCFTKIIKENNITLTKPRLAVLKVLSTNNCHLNVDDIYDKVKDIDENIGMATIYRTLNLFCDIGLIEKHDFKGCKTFYEKSDKFSFHHHHIIDTASGDIIEFPDGEIDKLLNQICDKYGYKMLNHKVEIYAEKK